jgi:hypothetical protein
VIRAEQDLPRTEGGGVERVAGGGGGEGGGEGRVEK